MSFSFFFFLIFITAQLLYNVVLVYAIWQRRSAVQIHISPLFWIYFPFRSPQSTEQSSLCYTVSPYQSFIIYVVVCIGQSQSLNPLHSLPPWYPFVLYICVSISFFANKFIYTIILDSTHMHSYTMFVSLFWTSLCRTGFYRLHFHKLQVTFPVSSQV